MSNDDQSQDFVGDTGNVDINALAAHLEQPAPLNPQQVIEQLQTDVVQLKMRAGDIENRILDRVDTMAAVAELEDRLTVLEKYVANVVSRHSLSDGSK